MPLNVNWKIEFLVLIMGPLFQNLAYLLLKIIFPTTYLVDAYHWGILKFNLYPIYPLDGGKLLNLLLNAVAPYKRSLQIVIMISYLLVIFMLFGSTSITINVIITYILLIVLIRREELKISFQYNKFLLERYLLNLNFKKDKIIKSINDLYRFKNNILKENGSLYSEKDFLTIKYKKISKKY